MSIITRTPLPRAARNVPARRNDVEIRLNRFDCRYRQLVRKFAAQHERLAELALSFPALLFLLAVRQQDGAFDAIVAGVLGAKNWPFWRARPAFRYGCGNSRPRRFPDPSRRCPTAMRFAGRWGIIFPARHFVARSGCARLATPTRWRMNRSPCGLHRKSFATPNG